MATQYRLITQGAVILGAIPPPTAILKLDYCKAVLLRFALTRFSTNYDIVKSQTRYSLSTDCYEVFCKMSDGYQLSVCGSGCGGYVKCEGGFAVSHHQCPSSRPYFSCREHVCVSSRSVCRECR